MPTSPSVSPRNAELAVLTDNTDEAPLESACRQAIAQDPCHVESFARLTTLLSRQGRVIDHDPGASMEKKKLEGYF